MWTSLMVGRELVLFIMLEAFQDVIQTSWDDLMSHNVLIGFSEFWI